MSWDDWSGFYNHVPSPKVDEYGYGIRISGLLISLYAKQGYIDKHIYCEGHESHAFFSLVTNIFALRSKKKPTSIGSQKSSPRNASTTAAAVMPLTPREL